MSKVKVRVSLSLLIDTDEYHIPADLKFKQSLSEDLIEAVESGLSLTVSEVIINKVVPVHDEECSPESYD